MGMYGYIREAVDSGKVLLEWDYSKGQPNVPLVKDTFGRYVISFCIRILTNMQGASIV